MPARAESADHDISYLPSQVTELMPHLSLVGSGRLTVLLLDVYDAYLYAPNGKWGKDQPYALSLKYLRSLKSLEIVNRSIKEMRQQGIDDEVKLAAWHRQMKSVFPDVSEHTVLTGVRLKDGTTIFYKGDIEVGRINDPKFTESFFNIWLSKKSSVPQLRKNLLNLK
jgi:hypothetical protein